jgi:predicted DNA-binding transcriptional regulator AlpA
MDMDNQAPPWVGQLLTAIEGLTQAVKQQGVVIPVDVDLWDVKHITAFLKFSENYVRTRVCVQPGFPSAIRITGGHPRWRARDVIEWAEQCNLRKPGRPRTNHKR